MKQSGLSLFLLLCALLPAMANPLGKDQRTGAPTVAAAPTVNTSCKAPSCKNICSRQFASWRPSPSAQPVPHHAHRKARA